MVAEDMFYARTQRLWHAGDSRIKVSFANTQFFLGFIKSNFISENGNINNFAPQNYTNEWISYVGIQTILRECLKGHVGSKGSHKLAHKIVSLIVSGKDVEYKNLRKIASRMGLSMFPVVRKERELKIALENANRVFAEHRRRRVSQFLRNTVRKASALVAAASIALVSLYASIVPTMSVKCIDFRPVNARNVSVISQEVAKKLEHRIMKKDALMRKVASMRRR